MKRISIILISLILAISNLYSNNLYTTPKPVIDKDLIQTILLDTADSTRKQNFLNYGTYKLSFRNDSTKTIILLHNGTEIKRLSTKRTEEILKLYPLLEKNSRESKNGTYSDTITDGKNGKIEKFDSDQMIDKIISLGFWEDKVELSEQFNSMNAGTYVARLSTTLDINNHYKFFYYGAGLAIHSHYGGLSDTISLKYPTYGGGFGFNLSIGLPFLKYKIRNAGEKIPYYAWLGNDLYSLFIYEEENSNFKIYKDGLDPGHSWNMEHQINLKVWNFYYDLIIDGDVYQNPIHILAFKDMNTFFGTWDLRVIKSPTVWLPGFRFTTKEIKIKKFKYKDLVLPLSTSIIYTDVYYKNISQYNIAFGIKFKLGIEDGAQE